MFSKIFKSIVGVSPATIFIGIFLAVLAVIILPNFTKVAGFFGYETRAALQEKLRISKGNVEVLSSVNSENKNTVEALKGTVATTEEVIVSKYETDKKIENASSEIKVKKDKKINIILSDPTKPKEVQEQEVSTVQLASMWDNFCSVSSNANCAANVTQGG